jgi:hypothetical protein
MPVWHRIFGALGASGPANHIGDLRERTQDVLHAVVQAVDLVE